jgi:ADP-ribose pyrophosphatase
MTGAFARGDERVLHEGPVVSVAEATIVGPGGATFQRQIVHHPGAVSIVAVTDDLEVVLVRQYRAALDVELLEIPAGKRDEAGEPPEATAERELIEEVGLRPGRLELLGEFHNSPGFSDEHSFVYLGTDLIESTLDRQGIEEEHMVVVKVPVADVASLIDDGTITDAKTIIGLLLAMRRLDR